jgi:hypothetical protein
LQRCYQILKKKCNGGNKVNAVRAIREMRMEIEELNEGSKTRRF